MIQIRCYTCNTGLAEHWQAYQQACAQQRSKRDALEELGLTRMCCKIPFITHVDVIDDLVHFANEDTVVDEVGTRMFRRNARERTVSCD